MKPTMTHNEIKTLRHYIDRCKYYLEFGSGESTGYAKKSNKIKNVVSVESSRAFCKKLDFGIWYINIGKTKKWGFPVDDSKKHLWPDYSMAPFASYESNYDLVLVDGRFRVACTLQTILNTKRSCKIIIHDFWTRPEYSLLQQFLDRIDGIDSMGVFKAKEKLNVPLIQSIIQKYQYLPGDKEGWDYGRLL